MAKLKPTVQYEDWTGQMAADGATHDDIHQFFRAKAPNAGMLVGWRFYSSEHGDPSLEGVFLDVESVDDAPALLATRGQVKSHKEEFTLTADEFLALFKRLAITGFKSRGHDFADADYDSVQD